MKDFWTFIGSVAVGILAVTGVYALEEEGKPTSIEYDDDEVNELADEIEEETDGDGRLIVRAS